MTKNRLYAIGEALIDFIPNKTGCDFDEITAFSPAVGGAPANVAAAFAKLGGKSEMLTQLGDDLFGKKIERTLRACGVGTSHIAFTQKAKTALAFVTLEEDGTPGYSFYRDPSADMLFGPDQLNENLFEDCFALHFCSVSLTETPMKHAHEKAIDVALQNGGIVSFDPNLRFMLWKDKQELQRTVWDFAPKAHILKLSKEELPFLTGETEIEKALPRLFSGNTKLVILTCGKDGAFAFSEHERAFAPAEKTKAVDTTGAGDAFIGSFLYCLYERNETEKTLPNLSAKALEEALCFSNRCCGISVGRKGAIASYPTMEEVKSHL